MLLLNCIILTRPNVTLVRLNIITFMNRGFTAALLYLTHTEINLAGSFWSATGYRSLK